MPYTPRRPTRHPLYRLLTLWTMTMLLISCGGGGGGDGGSSPPPPVPTLSNPAAGATVSGTVTLGANVVAQANVAKVEYFLNGTTLLGTATTAPFSLPWDTAQVNNGAVTLKAVATDVNGQVGSTADVGVTVANAVAVKLSQLQTQVFTPACSGCHSGAAASTGPLPASMNLTNGNSLANLANVASRQQPALMRVKPGDAANSYLIRKLEGTAGISGQRMPAGGPFLDAATIDQVKDWINNGARND
jgi:mono/diheme cytochrome c family protein